jgi:hypothetical protein
MLHVGLDLSRRRIEVCVLSEHAEVVEEFAAPPDGDGLLGLARRVGRHERPVRGVIESMTGARFVHDRPYSYGRADAYAIRAAAATLRRALTAAPPRVPRPVAQDHPRQISVRAQATTGDREVDVLVALLETFDRKRHQAAIW